MDTVLRASLFALATELDVAKGEVVFSSWNKPPRAREARVGLAANAVLNLFLTPRTVASAVERAGPAADAVMAHVPALRECGLLLTEAEWLTAREKQPYMNPPSLWGEKPQAAQPFESYEEAYANDYVPWNELPTASDVLSMVPLPGMPAPRLLDVGCGTGHNLALMEELGLECAGIDISPTAIDQIKAKAKNPDAFVAGSVTDLPWPDASFDVVTDIGCLHCLQDVEVGPYIAEVRRVLAPGGRFLCRSFKPRDEATLQAQPVKMERLGYSPAEIDALFADIMPIAFVKEGPVHGFYLAAEPAAGAG